MAGQQLKLCCWNNKCSYPPAVWIWMGNGLTPKNIAMSYPAVLFPALWILFQLFRHCISASPTYRLPDSSCELWHLFGNVQTVVLWENPCAGIAGEHDVKNTVCQSAILLFLPLWLQLLNVMDLRGFHPAVKLLGLATPQTAVSFFLSFLLLGSFQFCRSCPHQDSVFEVLWRKT